MKTIFLITVSALFVGWVVYEIITAPTLEDEPKFMDSSDTENEADKK